MTAAKLQNLLTGIPVKVLNKIQRLSKETGESVESIVEHAIALYEKRARARLKAGDDAFAKILQDPRKRAVFEEIQDAMSQRAHASMTPAERTARAGKAASARANALTKEERSKIARNASRARWSKGKGDVDGGSTPDLVE